MTHAATLDELTSVYAKNHSASMLAAQHQLSLAESIAAFFYRCESCSVIEMQAAKPNNGIGVKRRDGQGHSDPKTQKNSPNKAKAAAAHPKAEVSDLSDAAEDVNGTPVFFPYADAQTAEHNSHESTTANATSALPAYIPLDIPAYSPLHTLTPVDSYSKPDSHEQDVANANVGKVTAEDDVAKTLEGACDDLFFLQNGLRTLHDTLTQPSLEPSKTNLSMFPWKI